MIGKTAQEPIGSEVTLEMVVGEFDGRAGMFVFGEESDMLRHKHFRSNEYIEYRVHVGFVLRGGP